MSYTALYRKWRPDSFSDVKGQDHIVTTLKNQILSDRVGHAYLFCGTRGTGKTTVAKILAKAVNCENPQDGNPCGECAVCRAIADGSSLNVIEIDAASNNGVDNIRQIKEEVAYRPTEGRFKVYIIDEVHMLSIGAFNALLKTLEEPPEYVMFILATTEAHKIPVTIMSRCQRFDFKRISVTTISDRLRDLADREQAKVTDEALNYIARMADGAMRDALSLLDRCMAFYMDKELGYEDVLEVLGAVDTEIFSKMLRDIINEKVTDIIRRLDEMILNGRDLTQFVADFTWYLRNLMMLKASEEAASMIDMSAENMKRITEETCMVSDEQVMRYIRILSELSSDIRFSTQKRVLVEVALIKMCRPQMEKDMDSVSERLRKLEELVKEKEDLMALVAIRPEVPAGAVTQAAEPVTKSVPVIKALTKDLEAVAKNWRAIIGAADYMYEFFLKNARITAENDRLVLVTDNKVAYDFLNGQEHKEYIKGVIEKTIEKSVEIEVKLLQQGTRFEDTCVDIEEHVKLDIAIED